MSQFKIKSKPRLSPDQIARVADQPIEVPIKPPASTELFQTESIPTRSEREALLVASRKSFEGLDPEAKPDARLAVNARMNPYEMAVIKFFADRDRRSQAYIFREMLRIGMQQMLAHLEN